MFDIKPITSRRLTDCGAACTTSFLQYYGEDVTFDQIIEELNVKISGSSGKDILKVGRAHGLDMRAFAEKFLINQFNWEVESKVEVTDVDVWNLDRPSICWWKRNHWIICCGKEDNGKVVIMNPSRGRYGISESMFKMCYSGVFITNGIPQEAEKEDDINVG